MGRRESAVVAKGGVKVHRTKLQFQCSKSVLARVGDVQEAVLVLVLLVDCGHEGGCGRQHIIDENEDGLLWRQLDALADDVHELAYCQVGGHEVLLLVDFGDVALLGLLADDGDSVGVFVSDSQGFGLALVEGMLFLEL